MFNVSKVYSTDFKRSLIIERFHYDFNVIFHKMTQYKSRKKKVKVFLTNIFCRVCGEGIQG